MNNCTHVTGSIRIDSLFVDEKLLEEIKTKLYINIPSGEEGPLMYSFTSNRLEFDTSNNIPFNSYNVLVTGDLKGTSEDIFPEVIDWLKGVIESKLYTIRQCIFEIKVEGGKTIHLYTEVVNNKQFLRVR